MPHEQTIPPTTVHYSVFDEWYALNPPQCRWQYSPSAWFSACGKTWVIEGTPAQNNYRFCPWCGQAILEETAP